MIAPDRTLPRATRVALAMMMLAGGHALPAQGDGSALGSRINAVRNGTVRMSFAARPGVCGDGQNWFRTRPGNEVGTWNRSRDVETTCDTGPVRVVIERTDGITTALRTYVGGRWRANESATDLGLVSAPAAAAWLLNLAERESTKAASNAIVAATIADSVDAGPQLLRIARDDRRPNDVRTQAIFWVADMAGEHVTRDLDSIAYEAGDREVRQQAIFAVSRRPAAEAVPSLLKMAETLKDRELRKTAIFWLGRSKDPRAIAWFEQVLTRR